MEGKGYMFGSENIVKDRRPYFFKPFLDGFNETEHLRIPPQFNKHLLQDLGHSSKAILKGPSGETRDVRVVKTGENIFLKDGWKNFIRENSLGKNGFLFFTYDGNLCFNVQIFDVNGMERVSMPDPMKDQHPVAHEQAGPSDFRQPSDLKGLTKESCFEEKGKKKTAETISGREKNADLLAEGGSHAQYKSSKRKTYQKEKLVKSFISNLPYFEVRLKSYSVNKPGWLHIPNDFSRKNLNLYEKSKVVLRSNDEEKTWEVNFIPYGHGATTKNFGFCGGWTAFARDNNLKENDVCIFELVGPLEMKVHIFQSGSHH